MVLFKQICAFAHEAGENKTKILQVAGFTELQSCNKVKVIDALACADANHELMRCALNLVVSGDSGHLGTRKGASD